MRPASGTPAIIGINLDPVGAVADLIAHYARQAVAAVGFFRALRDAPLSGITLWPIAARRYDRSRDNEHARARDDSLLHRLLEADVGITRAFRSQVANSCKARQQSITQVIGRARHSQTERLARHLIVPGGLAIRMQQDVRVRFD